MWPSNLTTWALYPISEVVVFSSPSYYVKMCGVIWRLLITWIKFIKTFRNVIKVLYIPKYSLENPFTALKSFSEIAITPPNRSSYGTKISTVEGWKRDVLDPQLNIHKCFEYQEEWDRHHEKSHSLFYPRRSTRNIIQVSYVVYVGYPFYC